MKIKVGDLVWVKVFHTYSPHKWYRARVTKVGKVWSEFEAVDQSSGALGARWRLRLDTQDNGGNFTRYRWYTTQQRIDLDSLRLASDFLRKEGITTLYGSPWRARTVELAKLLGWVEPELPEWAKESEG